MPESGSAPPRRPLSSGAVPPPPTRLGAGGPGGWPGLTAKRRARRRGLPPPDAPVRRRRPNPATWRPRRPRASPNLRNVRTAEPPPPLNALSVPTEADWPAAWRWLAPRLDDRRVVALEGDLGAGKTTFVKAIAAALDADAAAVTSPTFSLVREYPTPAGPLLHLDLYRLDTVDEVLALDVEGLLDAARLAVVEWPGVARALLPPEVALWARIDPTPDGGRALALVTASPPDRPPGSQ